MWKPKIPHKVRKIQIAISHARSLPAMILRLTESGEVVNKIFEHFIGVHLPLVHG
jgi:hypothetical protein